MAFWSWSKTAASNATADATVNWAEGQPPSSVNDSARAMMARAAEWRDDISGTITTAGTSTAYTVTSNQVFDTLAHMNGAMIAFVPHTTNGATVTLNVDGTGAKPLRSAPSTELGAGVMAQGTPYVATYNNSDGAFYLRDFYGNPYNIPLGGMLDYVGTTAPNSNFVLPYGQALSRTTYAALFALTSTTFGAGDGVNTFNVIDLRGRTTFCKDDIGGSAANRITVAGGNYDGTVLGTAGGGQNQTLTQAQLPAVAPTFTGSQQTWSTNQTGVPSGASSQAMTTGPQGGVAVTSSYGALTVTVTPAGTISNLGSGSSHPIMPPSIIVTKILRVI